MLPVPVLTISRSRSAHAPLDLNPAHRSAPLKSVFGPLRSVFRSAHAPLTIACSDHSGADSMGHGGRMPATCINGWARGHREQKNSKQVTCQTVLTITKAFTKTTNCTCRAKKSGRARQTNIGGDLDRGLGGRSRRVSAEKIFLDGGGLTVFVNFNI